jgi:prepilin-type N-terminal cleavage/methylation domain-containing protein
MIWTTNNSARQLRGRDRSARPLRRGFSLVELIAVVALLAIFAGVAAVSVRGHVDEARLVAALNRIQSLDGRLRDEAQRLRRSGELSVDADDGRVFQVGTPYSAARPSRSIALGGGLRIDRLRTSRHNQRRGQLRVLISSHGQSDTYAVRLRTGSGRQAWLVVLASGQCLRIEQDQDVRAIFNMLSGSAGPHAG